MKETKVILTKKYQTEAMEELKNRFSLIIAEDQKQDLRDIMAENRDTKALISFLSDNIDKDIIDRAENLKIIANYAVGYNNIDFNYAIKKGIYVTNTPEILTAATADLTMALILAVARRIVEGDAFLRKGNFRGWEANLLLGKELQGSILGIIGLGRIGLATALRARGFGLKICYYDKNRKKDLEKKYHFQYQDFSELLKVSDIVSLHIPYTSDLHHLFNRQTFDLMKKEAIFINVSRGPLMDEKYLASKLAKKELFGAGLDVYEYEPEITEELMNLENVILSPHVGSATYKTRLAMAMMTVRNVIKALSGETPDNLISEWR